MAVQYSSMHDIKLEGSGVLIKGNSLIYQYFAGVNILAGCS